MFIIDNRSSVPIYEQLQQQVIDAVTSGVLVADDQLPAVRVLASQLGINPNTVQKAYQYLEHAGWIMSVSGKGSYVSAQAPMEQLRQAKLAHFKTWLQELKQIQVDADTLVKIIQEVYGHD